MAQGTQDARLHELAFLARLEREQSITLSNADYSLPEFTALLVTLLQDGCVNGLDSVPVQLGERTEAHLNFGGKSFLLLKHENRLWADIGRVLSGQQITARISHRGRVRRSELEQVLRTGRDREPFGILWARRHCDQAVAIALLNASFDSPVCLAYLDMNGLKKINDDNDHHAGDVAIKTFVQTIANLMGEGAEGFRGEGGDEVVVLMPRTPLVVASDRMRAVLMQLKNEPIVADGKQIAPHLTASCGLVTATDAKITAFEMIRRADAQQKRAKQASKVEDRPGVLAVEGSELEVDGRRLPEG